MSGRTDEKNPQLEMMSYPNTKKLTTPHHIRSLAVDFNKNFVKLIDLAADKEDAAVRRRIMFGTPHPIIHAKVKRAVSAAGPKDDDADWEMVNKEDLGVKEAEEARSTQAVDKDSDDDYVVVVSGKMEKSKTYTANLVKAGKQTSK